MIQTTFDATRAQSEALDALLKARNNGDAIVALAKAAWIKKHQAAPPAGMLPTREAIGAECAKLARHPSDFLTDIDLIERNPHSQIKVDRYHLLITLLFVSIQNGDIDENAPHWLYRLWAVVELEGDRVSHARWVVKRGKRGPHPWRNMVEQWFDVHRPEVEAKKYTTAIMPTALGSVLEVEYDPAFIGKGADRREVGMDTWAHEARQENLFDAPEDRLPLRQLQIKGIPPTDHQGQVSQRLRVFHEVYLATTGYDIHSNLLVKFDFDHFRKALYPDWTGGRFHTTNKDRLRQTIDDMRKAYLLCPRLGPFAPIMARTPVELLSRADDAVVFDVLFPVEADLRRGGIIQTEHMRELGFRGGRGGEAKYRLYHALAQFWDRHGTVNGKITWPTRPKVRRNREGHLINPSGKPLLDRTGKPITAWRHGEHMKDRHGKPLYEPNPKAFRVYPEISRVELQKFIGQRWDVCANILREMEADGIMVLHEMRDGYMIFPSVSHCQAYGRITR